MHVIALTGLLFQLVSGAPAPAAVGERTEYYEITGSSARELRKAIDRLRPTDAKGERFDAHTKWDVRWRYQLTLGERSCALREFGTSVQILITLPNWARRPAGSALAARWERYSEALSEHEREHVAIGVRAASAIQERVSALEAAPTCQLLEQSIKTKAESILDEFRAEEATYDRRTRHGATQGALFP